MVVDLVRRGLGFPPMRMIARRCLTASGVRCWHSWALDLSLIMALAGLVPAMLGAATFTQPYLPDSNFYLSLGAFGELINAHAVYPMYYWTRLGEIVPVHALGLVFDPLEALRAMRWLMLGLLGCSAYLIGRALAGRLIGVTAVLVVTLNTVALDALGDVYVSRTVFPTLSFEFACLVLAVIGGGYRRHLLMALAGAAAAVILLTSQIPGLVALLMLLVTPLALPRGQRRRDALTSSACAIAGYVIAGGALLMAGRVVFPNGNWFATTWSTVSGISPSQGQSTDLGWLWTDPSLLAPLFVTLGLLLVVTRRPALPERVRAASRAALVLNSAVVAFGLIMEFGLKWNVLEFQLYSGMLWAPALMGLIVILAALTCVVRSAWPVCVLAVLATLTAALMPTPRFALVPFGLLIGIVGLISLVLATRHGSVTQQASAVTAVAVALSVAVPQLLANGTDPRGDWFLARKDHQATLLSRSPDFEINYRQALGVTQDVLGRVGPQGRLMAWTLAPGGAMYAAMFLNLFGGQTVDRPTADYLRGSMPTHLVVVARTRIAAVQFSRKLGSYGIVLSPRGCLPVPAAGSLAMPLVVCPWAIRFR